MHRCTSDLLLPSRVSEPRQACKVHPADPRIRIVIPRSHTEQYGGSSMILTRLHRCIAVLSSIAMQHLYCALPDTCQSVCSLISYQLCSYTIKGICQLTCRIYGKERKVPMIGACLNAWRMTGKKDLHHQLCPTRS